MRRLAPVGVATLAVVAFLLSLTGVESTSPTTTVLVFSSTTSPRPTTVAPTPAERNLAAVAGYWAALNAGDPQGALAIIGSRRPDWEAHLGYYEFSAALGRRYEAECRPSVTAVDAESVVCEVAVVAPIAAIDASSGRPVVDSVVIRVRDGVVVGPPVVSAVPMVDDLLRRSASADVPVDFESICLGSSGRWFWRNGLPYNGPCGRLLAKAAPQPGTITLELADAHGPGSLPAINVQRLRDALYERAWALDVALRANASHSAAVPGWAAASVCQRLAACS